MDAERRGIGFNRWCLAFRQYLVYQMTPEVKRQNEYSMKDSLSKELYVEIGGILPSVTYCLAPQKNKTRDGAASLRAAACDPVVSEPKDLHELAKHGKVLYDWLKQGSSRVRMLLQWQACGGLSHVAAAHHRGVSCFIGWGQKHHSGGGTGVSLEDWQDAIKSRHLIGDAGMDGSDYTTSSDFR